MTTFVSLTGVDGLSIIILSGVRVSYKTAHTTTDTMANKINTVKITYCKTVDVVVDDSASSEQVIGSFIIMVLLSV